MGDLGQEFGDEAVDEEKPGLDEAIRDGIEIYVPGSIHSLEVALMHMEYVTPRDIRFFLNKAGEFLSYIEPKLCDCETFSFGQAEKIQEALDYINAHVDSVMAYDCDAAYAQSLRNQYRDLGVDIQIGEFQKQTNYFEELLLERLSDQDRDKFLEAREAMSHAEKPGVVSYREAYGTSIYDRAACVKEEKKKERDRGLGIDG